MTVTVDTFAQEVERLEKLRAEHLAERRAKDAADAAAAANAGGEEREQYLRRHAPGPDDMGAGGTIRADTALLHRLGLGDTGFESER